MNEILEALEACRQYVRFNHKATAWHNDREAYEIMTDVIEPAIKKALFLNQQLKETTRWIMDETAPR